MEGEKMATGKYYRSRLSCSHGSHVDQQGQRADSRVLLPQKFGPYAKGVFVASSCDSRHQLRRVCLKIHTIDIRDILAVYALK